MDNGDVFALYEWNPGECFRHPERGVIETACIEVLHPRHGPAREVRACRVCVAELELSRQRAAERTGEEWTPGPSGEC